MIDILAQAWNWYAWMWSADHSGWVSAWWVVANIAFTGCVIIYLCAASDFADEHDENSASVMIFCVAGFLLSWIWPVALAGLGIFLLFRYMGPTFRWLWSALSWPWRTVRAHIALLAEARRVLR